MFQSLGIELLRNEKLFLDNSIPITAPDNRSFCKTF
ncbi:hypothetical protein FHS56_002289 [Thermonema lapsum]|uniref:Uncharacterized protein n=1 Tax=Thermonema lapsum TaxID=28195 RepID=A0A846MT34_9BACT|nr:hypothetical protein [Thermonema lapsum]